MKQNTDHHTYLHAFPHKSENLEEKSNVENIDLKSNSFKGEFKGIIKGNNNNNNFKTYNIMFEYL